MKISQSLFVMGMFIHGLQAMEEQTQSSDTQMMIMQATARARVAIATARAETPSYIKPEILYWDEEVQMPITTAQRRPGIVYRRYNPNGMNSTFIN